MSKYKLNEIYEIDPSDCVINEALRGRYKPVPMDRIRELAESICQSKTEPKQLQPVLGRPSTDGKIEIVFGFTRQAALALAMSEKMVGCPAGLRVQIVDMDDQEATLKNIEENKRRSATSPVDDAMNIQRLKSFGSLTQSQIAKRMGVSGAWVSALLWLTKLSEEEKELVHTGKCGAELGVELAKLNKTKRKLAIAASLDPDTGNIEAVRYRKWAAEQIVDEADPAPQPTQPASQSDVPDEESQNDDDQSDTSEPTPQVAEAGSPGRRALKIQQVREYFAEAAEAADWPICMREFFRQTLRWMDNKIKSSTYTKKIEDTFYDNLTEKAQNAMGQSDEDEKKAEEAAE